MADNVPDPGTLVVPDTGDGPLYGVGDGLGLGVGVAGVTDADGNGADVLPPPPPPQAARNMTKLNAIQRVILTVSANFRIQRGLSRDEHLHIEKSIPMRLTTEIDDHLMRQAMQRSGAPTKKAAVEAGLRLLIETSDQVGIRRLRGAVQWHGDLAETRREPSLPA